MVRLIHGLTTSAGIRFSLSLALSIAFCVGFILHQTLPIVQFQPSQRGQFLILQRKQTSCSNEQVQLWKRTGWLSWVTHITLCILQGKKFSQKESIQSVEEGIEDAFKIEIIGTHHGHGLACFRLVKKQALGGKSVGLSYSGMSKK